jgi:replicative DNA helicase
VSSVGSNGFETRFDRIHQIAPTFSSLPFEIADRGGLTVPQIRAQAVAYDLKLKAKGKKLEVLCVDHLGLIKASANYKGNKVAETEEVSADLKAMAKDLDVAMVGLAQLSRQVEQRDDKRPNLSDLRWSGGIEQDADCVMFVYREEYYLTKKQPDLKKETERQDRLAECQNKIEVLIEKQRGGPTLAMEFFCDIGCAVVRDAVHG